MLENVIHVDSEICMSGQSETFNWQVHYKQQHRQLGTMLIPGMERNN